MPTPWSQSRLCNEGLVQSHCLAPMGEAAPLGNGTEGCFSLRVSDLQVGCPLCTLPYAPPALLGAAFTRAPASLVRVLILAGDLASSSLLQERRHLAARRVWSSSSEQQSQGMAPV